MPGRWRRATSASRSRWLQGQTRSTSPSPRDRVVRTRTVAIALTSSTALTGFASLRIASRRRTGSRPGPSAAATRSGPASPSPGERTRAGGRATPAARRRSARRSDSPSASASPVVLLLPQQRVAVEHGLRADLVLPARSERHLHERRVAERLADLVARDGLDRVPLLGTRAAGPVALIAPTGPSRATCRPRLGDAAHQREVDALRFPARELLTQRGPGRSASSRTPRGRSCPDRSGARPAATASSARRTRHRVRRGRRAARRDRAAARSTAPRACRPRSTTRLRR